VSQGVIENEIPDLVLRYLGCGDITQNAPDGTKVQMGYDSAGRLGWKRSVASDGTVQIPATWTYDLLDRVTQTVNPGGAGVTTNYSYSVSPNNPTWVRSIQTLDPTNLKAVTIQDCNLQGQVVWIQDPAVGDRIAAVTALGPAKGLGVRRNMVDMTLLASVAHRLKGASANVAAEPMRRLASALEEFGRRGEAAKARPLLPQLQLELIRLKRLPEAADSLASAAAGANRAKF